MSSILNVLLPACGLGQRNRAEGPVKELLIREGSGGSRPLIEFSFLHLLEPNARARVKKIVILTRKEKLAPFEAWLQAFKKGSEWTAAVGTSAAPPPTVEFFVHEPRPSDEWPRSLLAGQTQWADQNLVLLPDTQLMLPPKLSAGGLVGLFDDELSRADTFWAVSRRNLAQVGAYGMISETTTTAGHGISITEKPVSPTSNLVWGCFGFRKSAGIELMLKLEESTHSHTPFRPPGRSALVELLSFEDLSRT